MGDAFLQRKEGRGFIIDNHLSQQLILNFIRLICVIGVPFTRILIFKFSNQRIFKFFGIFAHSKT
jgi:hypothetical protein